MAGLTQIRQVFPSDSLVLVLEGLGESRDWTNRTIVSLIFDIDDKLQLVRRWTHSCPGSLNHIVM